MLYVRGNNGDTDDAEYYVNHLVLAVLRDLSRRRHTLLYYRLKPHHDGYVMTGCVDADGTRSLTGLCLKMLSNIRFDSPEGLYFICDYNFLFRTFYLSAGHVQLFP